MSISPWFGLTVFPCLFLLTAVIEHVRDGSIVRAILLPSYTTVTVAMSGIKVRSVNRYCSNVWNQG